MATLYKIVPALACTLFVVQIGLAQEHHMSKTVKKTFPLTDTGELILENKYGNVTITGWDNDEVSIEMEIKVNHRKRDKAENLLSRIRPDINSGRSFVSIRSEINDRNTGWFADFFNRTNPIDFDRSHVEIDFEVFLPKKSKLNITNRFGDVFIEDWNGELRVLMEHGSLWLNEDLNKSDIILKFGKIRAKNMKYSSVNIKNGELNMGNAKSLRLNTSGTEMKIGTVNSLEVYSNKDDIVIDEVGTIYGSLKFTTLTLEHLAQDVDLTMKITDFKVKHISMPETEISIEQESSDIDIRTTDFSHRFNATLEQGVLRLPKSFQNVASKMLDKSKKLRKIEATYGKGKAGSISIKGIKGIITLRE
ncbi:MAG: hypothetical protein ACFB0A_12995 [Croceivirga sp.]